MNRITRTALLVCLTLVATSSFAASPTTSLIEGMMTSAGGGAAADGAYDVTFSVYEASSGGSAVWSEGPVKVTLKGGQFSYALGSSKSIDIAKLGALKAQWLGVKIGSDPELARTKLHATLFTLHAGAADKLTCTGCITAGQVANGALSAAKMGFNYAGSATKGGPASDLACTGCVTVAELKFDKDVDLGGNSLKAKNGTFTGDVAAGTVTATSFAGDGSKLTGIKTPAGECKNKGEVVKGINPDGSLKCVAALDPTALPADGLNEISNDLLTNQFIYAVAAPTKKVPIPDNQGTDAVSNITFPNIGTAQTLDIIVSVENTDLSNVSMVLLPPDDKKTGYVLCDPCGKKDEKKYNVTFNGKNPPQEQKGTGKKIDGWIGGNPQGLWTLKVKDTSFCVPQAPGNSVYCNTTTKKDGWIADWSVKMQYISNQKFAVNGNQENSGNLNVAGVVKLGAGKTCDEDHLGAMRYDPKLGQQLCTWNWDKSNKKTAEWFATGGHQLIGWSGGCKSHRRNTGWWTYCLDGTDWNTAGDYLSVATSGVVTIKKSGWYRVNMWADGYSSSYRRVRLMKNGSQLSYSHFYNPHTGWFPVIVDQVWFYKKGDTVYVSVHQDTGNGSHYTWHSWNTAGSHSRLQIHYERPWFQ